MNKEELQKAICYLAKLYEIPLEGTPYNMLEEWKKYVLPYVNKRKNRLRIVKCLWDNKVTDVALKNISVFSADSEIAEQLESDIIRHAKEMYSTVSEEELDRVKELLYEYDVMYIKGSTLYQLYSNEYVRFQADVDVIVENENTFFKVAQKLCDFYSFERIKMYCQDDNRFSLSIDFKPNNRKIYRYIDLHLNPYYIWGGIFLQSDLWNRKLKNDRSYCPSKEDQLIMILAHTANQWRIRVRDINDMWLIISKEGKKLDWNYIEHTIELNKLDKIYNCYIGIINGIYGRIPEYLSDRKSGIYERIFMQRNLGFESWIGALGIEYSFCKNNYMQMYRNKWLWETIKNTWCMILFHNRAYWVNKIRIVKKRKQNEILVLTKVNEKIEGKLTKWTEKMSIFMEGKKGERIITPMGIFRQDIYHGKGR